MREIRVAVQGKTWFDLIIGLTKALIRLKDHDGQAFVITSDYKMRYQILEDVQTMESNSFVSTPQLYEENNIGDSN